MTTTPNETGTPPAAPADAPHPPSGIRPLIVALAGVGAAALATLAIGGIGEDVFKIPAAIAQLGIGGIPGPEDQAKIFAHKLVVYYKHSALWMGVAGAILGGAFGLALGLFRRSSNALMLGTVGGIVVGGVVGAASGPLAVFIDRYHSTHLAEGSAAVSDHKIMMMHAATWFVLGIGCALGTSLGARDKRLAHVAATVVVAGLAGLLGGVVYPVISALCLPLADPAKPIPELNAGFMLWLVWVGLPAALVGLALGRKG